MTAIHEVASQSASVSSSSAPPVVEPRESGRIRSVDALRGGAAVAVLIYHYTVFGEGKGESATGFHPGRYGVHMFFMISGFVILMSAARQQRVADFLWGRFARLYPTYWCAVGIALGAAWLSGKLPNQQLSASDAVLNLTMLQTAFGRPHADISYWTLYVELQFYLLVAIALCFGVIRHLPWCLLALVVIDTLAVFPQDWDRVPGWWRIAEAAPFWRWMYLFTFGVWLYRTQSVSSRSLILVGGICLLNAFGRGLDLQGVAIVATLGGLLALASTGRTPWLERPELLWFGTISYSLYLVHANVGYAIIRKSADHGWTWSAAALVATAVCIAIASCLTFRIERPAHEFLRHWWKARRRPT